LASADDAEIWDHARTHGFALVTLDADFENMSVLRGAPPKVIWIRTLDTSTAWLAEVLGKRLPEIRRFLADDAMACLLIDVREPTRR
jgi:predicted nuclease of predicted toxin-antitoxin system